MTTRAERARLRLFRDGRATEPVQPDAAPPGFDSRLVVEQLDDGRMELQRALTYRARDGERYTVPQGFRTDFDSTPLWLPGFVRALFRRQLDNARASVLHDYLYFSGWPRSSADALFAEALAVTGESWIGAAVMWLGVRVGGWLPWHRHRRQRTRAELAATP